MTVAGALSPVRFWFQSLTQLGKIANEPNMAALVAFENEISQGRSVVQVLQYVADDNEPQMIRHEFLNDFACNARLRWKKSSANQSVGTITTSARRPDAVAIVSRASRSVVNKCPSVAS